MDLIQCSSQTNRSGSSPTERTGLMSEGQGQVAQGYSGDGDEVPTLPINQATEDSGAQIEQSGGNIHHGSPVDPEGRGGGGDGNAPETTEEEDFFMYGARHVIMVFAPVSITMSLVIITVHLTDYYSTSNVFFLYTPFHDKTEDVSTKLWQSMANALILLGGIVVMTFLIFALYKYRCYKIMNGWMFMSCAMLLFFFSFMWLQAVLTSLNVATDYISMALLIWNFGMGGVFCIFWKGPLILQQAYLMSVSALVSLMFIKYLPGWTVWTLLGIMVVWDLIAVLCPNGPLRMLVELAQTRNEPLMPAMIYSSTMMWSITMGMADREPSQKSSQGSKPVSSESVETGVLRVEPEGMRQRVSTTSSQEEQQRARRAVESLGGESSVEVRGGGEVRRTSVNEGPSQGNEEEEDRGVKLGLGDFIFYSLLVGKTAIAGDWTTTMACFMAILVGLGSTLFLLAVFHKALPALPISIVFGLVFNFATSALVRPFVDSLASEQVFI